MRHCKKLLHDFKLLLALALYAAVIFNLFAGAEPQENISGLEELRCNDSIVLCKKQHLF